MSKAKSLVAGSQKSKLESVALEKRGSLDFTLFSENFLDLLFEWTENTRTERQKKSPDHPINRYRGICLLEGRSGF